MVYLGLRVDEHQLMEILYNKLCILNKKTHVNLTIEIVIVSIALLIKIKMAIWGLDLKLVRLNTHLHLIRVDNSLIWIEILAIRAVIAGQEAIYKGERNGFRGDILIRSEETNWALLICQKVFGWILIAKHINNEICFCLFF